MRWQLRDSLARSALVVTGVTVGGSYHTIYQRHNTVLADAPAPSASKPLRLEQVHVLFRHGARPPVFYQAGVLSEEERNLWNGKCNEVNSPPGIIGSHTLPKSGVKELDIRDLRGGPTRPPSRVDEYQLVNVYGGCRAGQLTDLGARQARELGKNLEERYGALLKSDQAQAPGGIWVRTSNVARCVATLSYALGEMPSVGQGPITAWTIASKHENLFPNNSCGLTAQLFAAAKADWSQNPDSESVEVSQKLKKYLPEGIAEKLKMEGNNFVRVRDYLACFHAHGLPRPWIGDNEELAHEIDRLGAKQIARFLYHDHELSVPSARAGVGQLLATFHEAMVHHKESKQVASLVSAHDTTLMPILSTYTPWNGDTWPDFCSWIAFELWTSDEMELVKVLFNGEVVREMSLHDFDLISRPYLSQTGDDACEPMPPKGHLKDPQTVRAGGEHW